MAGRGFGKTRAGAEAIRSWITSGQYRRVALVGETEADIRNVMIEGESGLLNICSEHERPVYEQTKQRLVWPNGAMASCYGAINYEKLRGPQFDAAWVDELAKFRYAQEAWHQLSLALRLGSNPRVVITTTPRPIPLIQELVKNPSVEVTGGSTFDNAQNLPTGFLDGVSAQFEGTRMGQQELYGVILAQLEGALWSYDLIESLRTREVPALRRIIVGVDPAVTSSETSDETGIIVAGIGENNKGYVLADRSLHASPMEWANRAVQAYQEFEADCIVAEVNNGGDLVETIIRTIDPNINFKAVRATRGKVKRAEPIAALYEQRKVLHTCNGLEKLEQQMCSYVPGITSSSPDRVDALVWGLTALMLNHSAANPALWQVGVSRTVHTGC